MLSYQWEGEFKTTELDASTKKIKANRTKETQGASHSEEPEKGKITTWEEHNVMPGVRLAEVPGVTGMHSGVA